MVAGKKKQDHPGSAQGEKMGVGPWKPRQGGGHPVESTRRWASCFLVEHPRGGRGPETHMSLRHLPGQLCVSAERRHMTPAHIPRATEGPGAQQPAPGRRGELGISGWGVASDVSHSAGDPQTRAACCPDGQMPIQGFRGWAGIQGPSDAEGDLPSGWYPW